MDDVLEYIEYKRNRRVTKKNKMDQDMSKEIIELLRKSTQGKDLIADNVLRELNITCRGRERDKLRNKISRIIREMKNNGIIEEYRTDARKRLRLIKLGYNNDQQD